MMFNASLASKVVLPRDFLVCTGMPSRSVSKVSKVVVHAILIFISTEIEREHFVHNSAQVAKQGRYQEDCMD